jgi:hypothetical protein
MTIEKVSIKNGRLVLYWTDDDGGSCEKTYAKRHNVPETLETLMRGLASFGLKESGITGVDCPYEPRHLGVKYKGDKMLYQVSLVLLPEGGGGVSVTSPLREPEDPEVLNLVEVCLEEAEAFRRKVDDLEHAQVEMFDE